MSRHPDQDRALAYVRRKGRDAPAEEIRSKVARTFGKLESALLELDEAVARRRPDAASWCVQEVVNHLAVSLEPGIAQLEALVEGSPPGDAIAASLLDEDAMSVDWTASVERLTNAHGRFLVVLDRAIDVDPPLDRTVPAVFLIKVDDGSGGRAPLEWVEQLDWKSFALLPHVHTLEHLDQIARIRERVT